MNPNIRIGHGYDCHRLALPPEGGPLLLGGLHLEHKMGPFAHSDGDALLHAVTDAVLGALGLDVWGRSFRTTIPTGEVPHPINFYGRLSFRLRN